MPTHSLAGRPRRLVFLTVALAALVLGRAEAQDTSRVLDLVNQHRAANGLSPLIRASELDQAAQRHSDDMANNNFFSHTGSDGSTPGQRITAAGYRWTTYGENIAAGYSTADAVVNGWMNSDGHRRNILNPNFREIGIAVTYRSSASYRYYWTQDFGARSGTTSGTTGGTSTGGTTGTTTTSGTPQLASISPARGPSGTTVALDGQYFGSTQGTSRVYFRRTNAYFYGSVTITSWSDRRVTARLSTSRKGTYYVWIRRGDGKSSNARIFTVE